MLLLRFNEETGMGFHRVNEKIIELKLSTLNKDHKLSFENFA